MTQLRCLVALSIGMIVQSQGAVLQTPTIENPVNVAPRASITASSVYENNPDFGTQRLIDGSTSPDWGNSWQAQGTLEGSGMRGTLPAWLIFDLQSEYTLSSVSLFNTMNYPHQDTGTREFSIQVSSDGVNYSSPVVSSILEWQNQTYQDFSFFEGPVSARYMQINLISAYVSTFNGLYNRVGLNEVKIMAVPEPSSLSLLALGGVVVALRRRR